MLSIVGTDRARGQRLLAGKVEQERLVAAGGVPYTIVRSTQFFEFLGEIADLATRDGTVRVTSAHLQPIAASDLARIVADIAEGPPIFAVVEVAGPEAFGLDELVSKVLAAKGDPRPVVADDSATYFGARLDNATLTPGPRCPPRLDDAGRLAQPELVTMPTGDCKRG